MPGRLRRLVRAHLQSKSTPVDTVAEDMLVQLVDIGVPIDSRKRALSNLTMFIQSAQERSLGDADAAARAICKDMALHTGWNLVKGGWLDDDSTLVEQISAQTPSHLPRRLRAA